MPADHSFVSFKTERVESSRGGKNGAEASVAQSLGIPVSFSAPMLANHPLE